MLYDISYRIPKSVYQILRKKLNELRSELKLYFYCKKEKLEEIHATYESDHAPHLFRRFLNETSGERAERLLREILEDKTRSDHPDLELFPSGKTSF